MRKQIDLINLIKNLWVVNYLSDNIESWRHLFLAAEFILLVLIGKMIPVFSQMIYILMQN